MRAKSESWSKIISFVTRKCSDGDHGEDIPTPNTNEVVILSSFLQCAFGLPTCEFLYSLLHHYEIELVHLNPNSILQIVVFVHLCDAFLVVPPNFSYSKAISC
jgi:hypothetical protein